MPASIESKIKLYEKRVKLEEQNRSYEIIKKRFLNWRLLNAKVLSKKKVIHSHFLPYSTLKRGFSRGKIDKKIANIYYFNRDEIKFIDLNLYNKLLKTNYKSVLDLANNAPSFENELNLKNKLLGEFDLSALIVLDEVKEEKLEIILESKNFEDVEDKLILT
jgi:hypothetical protein